jgi:signal transduction histidine kinase
MARLANFGGMADRPWHSAAWHAAAWRPSAVAAVLWAAWIALTMSAELLFQPFVWRNWPWDEVLLAWGELAVRRLEVALAIAAALMAAWAMPARSLGVRALLLAVAIAVAAWGAETIVMSEQTGFGDRAPGTRLCTWALLAGSVAAMFYLWRRGSEAREVAQALHLRHVQMQQQLTQVKLQALRSQIEPHFLFNTLATVRSLRGSDPQQGGRLLAHLIAYMRATGNSASPEGTTLAAEIEVIRAYLGVVAIRMSDRIAVAIDVPDDLLGLPVPPLSVATLVENAVKHGLAPKPDGGRVQVSASRVGCFLEVSVSDDGVGFGNSSGSGGTGIGLANVRARLRTLHGASASLRIRSNEPAGARVTLVLPLAGAPA